MAAKLDVVWSAESVRQVDKVIKFLKDKWSSREISDFLNAIEGFEEIVSRFPGIYPESQILKGYRKAVIMKQMIIIYSVDRNVIRIHTLFDTRQDPSKLR